MVKSRVILNVSTSDGSIHKESTCTKEKISPLPERQHISPGNCFEGRISWDKDDRSEDFPLPV